VSFVVKQTLAMFWLACALVFANAGFCWYNRAKWLRLLSLPSQTLLRRCAAKKNL
jgi:hypothetical protein